MHKLVLTIIFTFYLLNISFGQIQSFPWAKTATGVGLDEGIAICNDVSGNVYVTGQFTSPVITFGTYTLANTSGSTVFLTKYNSAGTVLWARAATCTGSDYGNSVTTDVAGNIFISGFFQSPSIIFGSFTLTNQGNYDIFLVKYDSGGNVIWARSSGGSGNDYGYSTKTDPTGNIYVAGSFGSPTTIFGVYTLTNNGVCDSYLTKYDTNGNVLWANNAIGTGGDETWSLCTDALGNVYVTGDYVSPTLIFGSYTLTNTGVSPMYIAKYNNTGIVQWAVNISGTSTSYDLSNWIIANAAGDLIITGAYTSSSLVIGSNTLINNGSSDVFIAKYTSSGNPVWAISAGSTGVDKGYSLSADANNIYCFGSFTNSIIFGTNTLTPPVNAPDPVFIITLDYSGNVKCASYLNSGGDDQAGISADNLGNAYITSDFVPTNLVIGTTILNATGGENFYVAKYICAPDISNGILNYNQNLSVNTFPNPNNGIFNFEINNEIENGELILINYLGEEVYNQKIKKGENSILAKELNQGLYYYILLQNKQQVLTGRLIFE